MACMMGRWERGLDGEDGDSAPLPEGWSSDRMAVVRAGRAGAGERGRGEVEGVFGP